MPDFSEETRSQNLNATIAEVTPASDTAAALAAAATNSPAPQQATPLDPAAATQAWLDSVPQDKREKSDAYFEGGYWLILWNYLVAAGISILLLSSRISARLRDSSERLTNSKTLQVACYSVLVFVARLCFKFSAQPLRTLFPRASIRSGHPDFPRVVSRTS